MNVSARWIESGSAAGDPIRPRIPHIRLAPVPFLDALEMPAVVALLDGGDQVFERQFADELEQAQQAEQARAGRDGIDG